jgi:bifunctional non-homologous end joining protein LigD
VSTLRVGSRQLELTHEDKVLFPRDGITKGDLVAYYRRIARHMLPHLRGRPLMLHRFPDGIEQEGFYQKEASDFFPEWIKRVAAEKEGGVVHHVVCNDAATLVYLANLACITPHAWLSRSDRLDNPDRMIFDLDPSANDFEPVRDAARSLKRILESVGLVPFLMTTGSRGLHVTVPLDRSAHFDAVRKFARDLAGMLAEENPKQLTVEQRKNKRGARVFIDTNRDAYGQTAVAVYAVRAKNGAPIATPLEWPELDGRALTPQRYNIGNIFQRLAHKPDPWAGLQRSAHSLSTPRRKLEALLQHKP